MDGHADTELTDEGDRIMATTKDTPNLAPTPITAAGSGGTRTAAERAADARNNDPERARAIDTALAAIDKQFGKGAIMRLGKDPLDREIHVIPTGSLGFDLALGIGGLPRGRVVEIYGPESSGKTTLALSVVAEMQKIGGTAAFIDAEHALDPQYAAKLGVDIDQLLISQPDNGEQ